MTKDELFALHNETTEKCLGIMKAKNHDYTGGDDDPFANFRDSEILGIKGELGLLLRVIDKIKRMQTYINKGSLQVENEGFEDACDDVINYMVLLKGMYRDGLNT